MANRWDEAIQAGIKSGAQATQSAYAAEKDKQLRELLLGKEHENKLSEAQAERDGAQAVQDKNYARTQEAIDNNAAKGNKASIALGKDGAVSMSLAEADPSARLMGAQSQEGVRLKSLADKTFGGIKGQADALETIRALIKDPNSVNDQQLAVAQARLSEGQGQRLLQSVIEHSGASNTANGSLTGVANYLRGGGLSKLQPGQVQAMQDNIEMHRKLLDQQMTDAGSLYHAQAPIIAPHLGGDTHEAMFNSYAQPFKGSLGRLAPPATAADPTVQKQTLSPQPAAAGPVDKLRAFLGMSGQAAPQQAPAAGGFNPDAYLKGGK